MPVVNTTSPSAYPSAPQTSPSKRVPSSRSTYPDGWAISDDQPLHGLELRRAGALEQLEQRGLHGAHDRARALHPPKGPVVVDLVARPDRVGGHVNLDPILKQIVHGLGDTDVRLDPAHDRLIAPVQVKALGARR